MLKQVAAPSMGIAISPDDGETVEALLSRSDKALYQAKTLRGGFVFVRNLAPMPPAAPAAETAFCQRAA